MCIGCRQLGWPLQQQTFMTLGVRYQSHWYAESLGELKGRICWERPTGKWQGFPRDQRLWGYAGAFPPIAGSAETPAPPMPARPASDVGAPGWELLLRLWWLLRKPTMVCSGFVVNPSWVPPVGNTGCTTAVLEILLIGGK